MHNISLKWKDLTDSQKSQVKDNFRDQLRKKEIFEHILNKRMFKINPLNGDIIL